MCDFCGIVRISNAYFKDTNKTNKDETITRYANGDAVVGGVLYKQGEFVPGYGIDGGVMHR